MEKRKKTTKDSKYKIFEITIKSQKIQDVIDCEQMIHAFRNHLKMIGADQFIITVYTGPNAKEINLVTHFYVADGKRLEGILKQKENVLALTAPFIPPTFDYTIIPVTLEVIEQWGFKVVKHWTSVVLGHFNFPKSVRLPNDITIQKILFHVTEKGFLGPLNRDQTLHILAGEVSTIQGKNRNS